MDMEPPDMAEKTPEKAPGAFSLLGTASTMGLHMVSGPIVGGGLGWLIDQWLDSWPIASAVGLVLGLAAGFRNVWADARYLERSNAALDEERRKSNGSDDDRVSIYTIQITGNNSFRYYRTMYGNIIADTGHTG